MDRACHISRPRASRPFVVTAYVGRGDRLVPDLPEFCLERSEGDDASCRVIVHGWRRRKTGPCFPLCVVECVTHAVAFTLYPLGHVPYGRAAIAPVSSDGQAPVVKAAEGHEEPVSAWAMTLFRAACDASCGHAWPRVACEGQESFRTQCRRVTLAATLLGVHAESDAAQLAVALALGVPALTLRDAGLAFHAPSWRPYTGRGRALLAPLAELARAGGVLGRVLEAGALVGQWGIAHRWESRVRVLRARPRAPP